ncbi:MAG: DUF3034 family protein [Verrucomicrobiota bacterium]
MKSSLNLQTYKKLRPGYGLALASLLIAALPTTGRSAEATPAANAEPVKTAAAKPQASSAEKPAPLPLHQIEGNGGIFSTLSAYIVNPPRNGEPVGRPSVGFAYIDLGHGQNLEALTLTESPFSRLELGYGFNNFNLGNLPLDVYQKTGGALTLSETAVQLHNFNARVQILKEGEFDQKWIPALTFGTHYKYNATYNDVNNQLNGTLNAIGVTRNDGVDFTLYASKLFTQLPRPVLVELGGRATEGVWNGLLGFTDSYQFLFEGNVVVFLTDSLALAAEYKEQATDYTAVPGLIGKAGDWWTIDLAYVVNTHLTFAVGYGHFGTVLNNNANSVWGVTTKWEF